MVTAVNVLVACGGGIAVCDNGNTELLPLPVAGLMSTAEGDLVAQLYSHLNHCAKALGSPLRAPFMTLSFMALLVIPNSSSATRPVRRPNLPVCRTPAMTITFFLNQTLQHCEQPPHTRVLDYLRQQGQTAAKPGCQEGAIMRRLQGVARPPR